MSAFGRTWRKMSFSKKCFIWYYSHSQFRNYRIVWKIQQNGPPILSNYGYQPQLRQFSSRPNRNFISQFVDNLRQELSKNKEMKESLKKFREEAEKLEKSEALQKARRKYEAIESETTKGSQQILEQFEIIKGKIKESLEEAQKSEIGKKGKELTEELAKSAKTAAESLAKQGEQIGKSTPIKVVSESVKAVKQQIDETAFTGPRVYKAPSKLQKRTERTLTSSGKTIQENKDASSVVMHKDSKWFQSWQNFKDNNPYVNKMFDWKMKYDESDNPVLRASRVVTDKVSDILGGLFQKTEMSEVLTEIIKTDPNFDKDKFLRECEDEIIPNILEAMIRGDLEILKDWCHEAPYNILSTPIKQAQALGYKFESRILDVSNVDLAMGKMMEQGPVLIITFQSQQIMVVVDSSGKVVEGDRDKIIRMHYVWVLCRDQTELDHKVAWKLMDLSANSAQQWL
ncbi:mitochondrial import inner membrane translocase subunit TIM44-like [Centruroides sculpturatus]|uniref:mitochondrial import inner membrane translocase subunit TIM44-like n=1 Tax=Centruroides sculpturatus TaxID=218467 RepID=UPI000C6E85CC|nr:mitochondrial import inner membrane translocase subunit TIM44-like [Centruroides sculpturatus]